MLLLREDTSAYIDVEIIVTCKAMVSYFNDLGVNLWMQQTKSVFLLHFWKSGDIKPIIILLTVLPLRELCLSLTV